MGYTTRFNGAFALDRPLTHEHAGKLRDLYEAEDLQEDAATGCPGGYCQWVVSKDRGHIEHDQNEKFYDYTPWLRFLIAQFFMPWGYVLSGDVVWQGEETGDVGVLHVVDNIVTEHKGVTTLAKPKKGDATKVLRACLPILEEVVDGDDEDLAERAAVVLRDARAALGGA